jgi:hypothetical protein
MSGSIQIGPGQFHEVLESSEHLLVLETTYAPGGSPPPPHFHPAQTEHFDIPPNTPHRMWNPSGAAARARWETRLAGRTEQCSAGSARSRALTG